METKVKAAEKEENSDHYCLYYFDFLMNQQNFKNRFKALKIYR